MATDAVNKAFREKARREYEAQQAEYKPRFTTSTSYPGWQCNNCHRRFSETTELVQCPGKPAYGDIPAQPCGGVLVRWQRYEVKTG